MVSAERVRRRLEALAAVAVEPGDSEATRFVKTTFTVVAGLTAVVATAWVIIYLVLGQPMSAAIPLTYQLLTVLGLVLVARTKRFVLLRRSQLTMFLSFPFLLMWSLGGFANGSGVAMWGVSAPLIAIGRHPWPWFGGFVALSLVSGAIDGSLAATAPEISSAVITGMFVLNFVGVAFVVFVAMAFAVSEREKSRAALAEKHRQLEVEQDRSERLLLNVLPAPIAERLKAGEEPIADRARNVTVLFADVVGFTSLSERMSPEEVVNLLNGIFTPFDELVEARGLEKITTVGDAFIAVGGLPLPRADHAEAIADLALAMRDSIATRTPAGAPRVQMRFGISSGPVAAGVIGKRKFNFSVWGDTVNTASRMESTGMPGRIQVTEGVYQNLRDGYAFEPRGSVSVKGKGQIPTYFLEGRSER